MTSLDQGLRVSRRGRRRTRGARVAAALLLALTLAAPSSGLAEVAGGPEADVGEEIARQHFRQGVALARERAWTAALAEFRACYDITHEPAVLYNIGVVERELRRYADAADTLRRYLAATEGTDADPARRDAVRVLVRELEAVLGTVAIETSPPGVELFVDGDPEGTTPLARPLRLEAGEHRLELRLDGYVPRLDVVEVHSRSELQLSYALERVEATRWYRQWWLWTTVGVVVAGAVLATTLALTLEPDGAEFGQVRIETE